MTITLFAPYGTFSPEAGLLCLWGRYLTKVQKKSVHVLLCNGAFSLCDRDEESQFRRSFTSCADCISEQRSVVSWGEFDCTELSSLLTPDEILESEANIGSEPVLPMEATESFKKRFGTGGFDPAHRAHVLYANRLSISVDRMKRAMVKYLSLNPSRLLCVAGGGDFLSRTAVDSVIHNRGSVSIFSWSMEQRGIKISHPQRKEYLACALVISEVRALRQDPQSWSPEVVGILKEISEYIVPNE